MKVSTDTILITAGLRRFREKQVLDVEGLEPRVDSPAWSLMAWVQLPKNGGANILRKPLGKSQSERELSCWSWHVGKPSDRLDFGAHDFRGGSLTSKLQESAVANASAAADGLLHNVALVATPSNITFYMDAKVQVESVCAVCRFFFDVFGDSDQTETYTHTSHPGCRGDFASRDRLQRYDPRAGRRKHSNTR